MVQVYSVYVSQYCMVRGPACLHNFGLFNANSLDTSLIKLDSDGVEQL